MKQEALGVALSILNLEHISSTDTGCGPCFSNFDFS